MAYGAMFLVLIPFAYLIESPITILFPALIIGMEYSYIFPRQAMKLYEEISFKSVIERFQVLLQVLILVLLGVFQVYTYKKDNPWPLFLISFVYLVWYHFFHKQSLIVGSKNIAIGRSFFSHDSISSILLKKKGLVVEVNGEKFTIYKWALGKKIDSLETFVKVINQQSKV